MAGTLVAVANMKGGVGKTTTVVSLAETLAAASIDTDDSILVMDLDPQSSASIVLAGDDLLAALITEGRTLEAFLEQRLVRGLKTISLASKVRNQVSDVTHKGRRLNLSLLACGRHLRITEREILIDLVEKKLGFRAIEGRISRELKNEFDELRKTYRYIIIDCAPGISPVTEAAIRASDVVLVPTIADYLSVMGLNAFCRSLWDGPTSKSLPKPQKPHVLVTRWQGNVRQQREQLESLIAEAKSSDAHFHLLKTRIPQSAALAEALTKTGKEPTFSEKYGRDAIGVLADLLKELKGAI